MLEIGRVLLWISLDKTWVKPKIEDSKKIWAEITKLLTVEKITELKSKDLSTLDQDNMVHVEEYFKHHPTSEQLIKASHAGA